MRALIRPTLFASARLSLFLAVIAWIAGQWFRLDTGPFELHSRHTIRAVVEPQGIVIRFADDRFTEIARYIASESYDEGYEFEFDEHGSTWAMWTTSSDGLESYIAIRHWIIVTVMVAINLLLHFLYRKRSTEEAGNSSVSPA